MPIYPFPTTDTTDTAPSRDALYYDAGVGVNNNFNLRGQAPGTGGQLVNPSAMTQAARRDAHQAWLKLHPHGRGGAFATHRNTTTAGAWGGYKPNIPPPAGYAWAPTLSNFYAVVKL